LASGHAIDVSLTYLNGVLRLSLTDLTTSASFTTNVSINIPALVGGNSAYVGFTAGAGAVTSVQYVSVLSYVGLPGLAIQTVPGTATLSWPAGAGGYVLQQSAAVSPTSWTNVAASPVAAGQINQVTLPAAPSHSFYRLTNNP
jgi:hypothetical protein